MRHVKTVVYRPQVNRTERVNRDLEQMITNYVNEQHDTWDEFLREFAYSIRTAVNEPTDERHTNKNNKRGPLITSIPSSWSEKSRIKRSKNEIIGYKRSRESGSSGPERKISKFRESSDYRVPKRALSSNDSNVLQKCSRKRQKQDKVAVSTNRYNLRPRGGTNRLTMERKTQQGGPVRSRKSRGKNGNPYIEERTRSGNRNARRRGDTQREEQERKGASTRRSLSLEVMVGNANYKS
ncbi:uncharacterized protein TNCV_4413361 [Trichonephila clavipes]|nr:uncharacterized protein TNCV_4413361 [Trichonephila clavipes]